MSYKATAKVISLALAMLLIGSVVYAATPAPANENVIYQYGKGQSRGGPMCTVVVPVRYGESDPNEATLSSGDVVIWDTNSADGYSIEVLVTDLYGSNYAGVMVTDILTDDNGGVYDIHSRNWGWMAIEGYCLAKVDSTYATVGMSLQPNGSTLEGSFRTAPLDAITGVMSEDMGLLFATGATDAAVPVWLR